MKERIDLDFCFKGSRKYVHGTDIFAELTKNNNDMKNIDLAFHGITVKNMTFFTEKPENSEIKVTFRCLLNGHKIRLFGIENDSSVNCQYEYMEEKIVENSLVHIPEESIILQTQTEYSFIEHIVAMNKVLVEKLYSNVSGKWYFTRLQLKENIEMTDVSSLQLILKSNFQFKLTKSAIIVNDMEVGFIYFSLIPKEA